MLTLDQLSQILVQCAGENESIQLDDQILDRDFTELGYDSLALLETSAQLKRQFGIDIADEDIGELTTPRLMLKHANELVAAKEQSA